MKTTIIHPPLLLLLLLLPTIIIIIASATLASHPCSLDDYERHRLSCQPGTLKRSIRYDKVSPACIGPPHIDLGEKEDCNPCTLTDFLPTPSGGGGGTCVGGSMSISDYAVPGVDRCPRIAISGNVPCPCSVSDVSHAISPCRNGTRRYIPYFATACDQTVRSATKLAPSAIGPCDAGAACFPGQSAQPLCSPCFPGSYSSSKKYSSFADGLPVDFIESCLIFSQNSALAACPSHIGWRPSADGSYITTGDVKGIHSVDISIGIHLDVTRLPARFGFDYRLSTEADSDFFAVISSTDPDGPVFFDSGAKDDEWQSFSYEFHADTEIPADELCSWSLGIYEDNNHTDVLPIATTCVTVNQLRPFESSSFWPAEPPGTSPSQKRTQRKLTLLPIFTENVCADKALFAAAVAAHGKAGPGEEEELVFVVTANDTTTVSCTTYAAEWAYTAGAHGIIFVLAGEGSTVGTPSAHDPRVPTRNRFLGESALQYPRGLRIGTITAGAHHHERFLAHLFGTYTINSNTPRTPRVYVARQATLAYNREPGHRIELLFLFFKDASIDSTGSSDHVDISNIWFDTSAPVCVPADPGHYVSTSGATEQSPCERGYYSPEAGRAGCLRCAPGSSSAEGATGCTPVRSCRVEDYEPHPTGPCLFDPRTNEWMRNVTFRLPVDLCASNSVKPPADRHEECDFCPFGAFHEMVPGVAPAPGAAPNNCVACNSSLGLVVSNLPANPDAVSVSAAMGCRACTFSSTEIPARRMSIVDFATLDAAFNGGSEFALPAGWRCPSCALGVANDITVLFIGSKGASGAVEDTLTIDFDLERTGSISFDYFLRAISAQGGDGVIHPHLSIDVSVYAVDAAGGGRSILYHQKFTLSPHRDLRGSRFTSPQIPHGSGRQLVLKLSESEAEFGLKSISIDGVRGAPAESCISCPAGFSCLSQSSPPVMCPPGQHSWLGDMTCEQCTSKSSPLIQPNARSALCLSCPAALVAEGGVACQVADDGFFPPRTSNVLQDGTTLHELIQEKTADPKKITREVGDTSVSSIKVVPFVNLNLLFRLVENTPDVGGLVTFPRTTNRDFEVTLSLTDPTRNNHCLSPREREYTNVSYGCATNSVGRSVSIGNVISRAEQQAGANGVPGVAIHVTGLPCDSVEHPDNGALFRTFTFEITCDANYDVEPAIDPSPRSAGACHSVVRARHASVCPMCMPQDHMAYVDLKCVDGRRKRIKNYTWVDDNGNAIGTAPCSGGYKLPPAEISACSVFDIEVTSLGLSVGLLIVILVVAGFLLVAAVFYAKASTYKVHYDRLYSDVRERFGEAGSWSSAAGGGGADDGDGEGDTNQLGNHDDDDDLEASNNAHPAADPYSDVEMVSIPREVAAAAGAENDDDGDQVAGAPAAVAAVTSEEEEVREERGKVVDLFE